MILFRRPRTSRLTVCLTGFLVSITLLVGKPVNIAEAYLINDGIAVFKPEADLEGTLPSLAVIAQLTRQKPLPTTWNLRPIFSEENEGFSARIVLPEGCDLYATGEVTGPLRRNGREIELWNTDNFACKKHGGKRLYQSHPWVLGLRPDGRAFGLLFDTTWRASLATDDSEVRLASDGPAFRVIIINRDTPQSVMRALAELTGHPPLPPRWALGYHQCRYSYYPDSRVREIADTFRRLEIPCDVIWMDIHYMDGYRIFTFDPDRFPDPEATNAYLHSRGFHSIWMIDPGVKQEPGYPVYDSGTTAGIWVRDSGGNPFVGPVWPGDCVFPDFTMPEARSWWAGLYPEYLATGIDGVWNDMNEPSVFDNATDRTMPEDNWHRGGGALPPGPHLRYHNVYGMLMVKASVDGLLQARPDKRPFVLTRANFLGGHRYAASWTGDNRSRWPYLKESIPMSLNLSLSGQPFNGPDIGGFSLDADPVLFGHWIALGAFYPFCRAHNDDDPADKEPWVFGDRITEVTRTALSRRYRLLPYLYTCMAEASRSGQPVMQPVFFADPADPSLRGEEEAFLFGPDLLVIPQWAFHPALPEGNWPVVTLLEPGREADGYQPEIRQRPGSIIPLGKVVQNTTEASLDPLTLLIALDENDRAQGQLFEDAGDGFGPHAWSTYEVARSGDTVTVRRTARVGEFLVPERQVRVRLLANGQACTASGNPAEGIHISLPEGTRGKAP